MTSCRVFVATLSTLAVGTVLSAAASATSIPGLPNCLGKPVAHPRSITVYCADAGEVLTKIGWSSWGGASSHGTGLATYNDCKPSCVQGHTHTFRALLTVFGRQRCSSGGTAYRSLRIVSSNGAVKPLTMAFRCS